MIIITKDGLWRNSASVRNNLNDNGILSCDYIAREKETIQGEENPCGGTCSSSLTMSSFMVSIIINSVIYRRLHLRMSRSLKGTVLFSQ